MTEERRQTPREAVDWSVSFRAADLPEQEHGRVLNVSDGGLLLVTTRSMLVGTPIDVTLPRGAKAGARLSARVVRLVPMDQSRWWGSTRREYHYGCRVEAPATEQATASSADAGGAALPSETEGRWATDAAAYLPDSNGIEVVDLSEDIDPYRDDWATRVNELVAAAGS